MDWKMSFTCGPGCGIAAGHDGGAVARAFFAAGDAGADEENAFLGECFGAAVGIGEVRVAAVDDDVALFEVRQDGVDHLVDGVAGFDHQHDAARGLEQPAEFFDGMRADDIGAFRFIVEEVVDFGDGPVEDGHVVAVVIHIEDQILAHDGEADQSDITRCLRHISP